MEEKNDALRLFRECVRTFTTQPLDMIFYPDSQGRPLLILNEDNWEWNLKHPIWNDQREATWAFREIGDIFLHEYVFYLQDPHDETAFIKQVRQNIALQLSKLLQTLTYGLDLDLLTALACECYESAPSAGLQAVLLPFPMEPAGMEGLSLFEKTNWVRLAHQNIHALRKYLNMGHNGCLAICHTDGPKGKGFYAVGLAAEGVWKRFPRIRFTEQMEWQFCLPPALESGEKFSEIDRSVRIRHVQGRLLLPLLDSTSYERREFQRIFGAYEISKREETIETLISLLWAVKRQKKGALLIVSEEAIISNEAKRLCDIHCGIALDQKNSTSSPELLAELCAIDGAVLADLTGRCWACGVILDGRAVNGDMSRGSRFNSAQSYLHFVREQYRGRPLLGIVVSEDGMLNFLDGKDLPESDT